jgi:hypothetical protein
MRNSTPASFVMSQVKDQRRAEKSPAKLNDAVRRALCIAQLGRLPSKRALAFSTYANNCLSRDSRSAGARWERLCASMNHAHTQPTSSSPVQYRLASIYESPLSTIETVTSSPGTNRISFTASEFRSSAMPSRRKRLPERNRPSARDIRKPGRAHAMELRSFRSTPPG